MKLIIYMPALNEAGSISQVLEGLPRALAGVDSIEYLVVDDGSADDTAVLARAAGATVVSHGRNRGVGAAFRSAVMHALQNGADLLVSIDADGQFDAREIAAMIDSILRGEAEMVIGNRFAAGIPRNMSRLKYWGNNRVADLIRIACGQQFQDVSCGFRAYSREALLRLNTFGEFTYTHETILSLAYQGMRILELPVRVEYDVQRKSRVASSIAHYAIQTSKIMFRVMLDYKPMRVFGGFAAVLGIVGGAFVLYLLGHYAMTGAFTPYKSFGFIGLGFVVFGVLVFLIALVADMMNRLRRNQDSILLELRQMHYDGVASPPSSATEEQSSLPPARQSARLP